MKDVSFAKYLYDNALCWFTYVPMLTGPLLVFINAPFGRFALKNKSIFTVDGIKSWIVMESVAPLTFMYTFLTAPLTPSPEPFSISFPPTPQAALASLFLLHYSNRALASPLRTPVRSPSHIIIPAVAIVYNLFNGSMLGAWLSSPAAAVWLKYAYSRPSFWIGVALFAVGMTGNILHDEILLNIRRDRIRKEEEEARKAATSGESKEVKKGANYAIPYGYLYKYISYPNYFCEWIEWTGFALAASPLPIFPLLGSARYMLVRGAPGGGAGLLAGLTPPWAFVFSEVLLMVPRAWRGHQWYKQKFPDYPKERKAVVPFVV